MTTARESIRSALDLLSVIDEDEEPTARQAQDALKALNKMCFGFKAKGADLRWQTVGLTTALPIAEEFVEDIEYLLALRLAPTYGTQLTPEVATRATQAMNTIQAHFKRVPTLRPAPGLLQRDRLYGRYDPETDQSSY